MHCDLRGQQKIASILEAEIKDQIYVLPEDFATREFYPSLESLKRKFIIKSKGTVPASQLPASQLPADEDNEPSMLVSTSDDPCIDVDALMRRVVEKVNKRSLEKKFEGHTKAKKNEEEERKSDADNISKRDCEQNTNDYVHNQLKEGHFLLHDRLKNNILPDIPILRGQMSSPATFQNRTSPNPNLNLNAEDIGIVINTVNSEVLKTESGAKSQPNLDDIKTHEGKKKKKKKKEKKVKSYDGLAKYYTLFGSKMNFTAPRSVWEISSLSEDKIKNLMKSKPLDIIDFCKKYFIRVYPGGTRVDSSNYDPVKAWTAGGQMVALNYQTADEAMLLNYAKFAANGGIGYVLKPDYLTSAVVPHPSRAIYPHDMTTPKMKIKIRVISGQQFHFEDAVVGRDIIDPFVEIKLRGIDLDEESNPVYKTHVIKDNGFNPIWSTDGKVCEKEFTVIGPEHACLVFRVFDANLTNNTKLAWYAIEVPHLLQGYRVLPMLNSKFDQIPHCYLYVHVTIVHLDRKAKK